MIRFLFIGIHAVLTLYFVFSGVQIYRVAVTGWDAGIPDFFCAFWFLLAAAGFYLRNVWLVTTYTISMFSVTALYLLISAASYWTRAGEPAGALAFSPSVLVGFLFFLVFCEGVSIYIRPRGPRGDS